MIYKPYNTVSFRCEVLRGGGVYAELEPVETPEVICDADTELILSLRGTYRVPAGLDLYTDRLRPVASLNGTDYPLGVYVVTTAERREDDPDGRRVYAVEGYSPLYLAKRKKIETRLSISAGVNYIAEITTLLATAGITDISAAATAYTMATAREDWDVGTPVLEIVNALLSEISYRPAYVDLDGKVRLEKYAAPTADKIDHIYAAGEASVILPTYKITDDRFDKANVFIVRCDSPDREALLTATAENNSAESPYSTVKIGRVLHVEDIDNVPSQAALQERADMLRDQSMQAEEEIEFSTALAPDHHPHSVVAVDVGGASGVFSEVGWRIRMEAGATMTHTARRIV